MASAAEVLCIGESMVLVAPVSPAPLDRAELFRLDVAGAESTVALYLEDLGIHSAWASRVGDDPLGRRVVEAIARRGVDTSHVRVDAVHPTGVYFKDPGALATAVHYYRRGSAASHMGTADLGRLRLGEVQIVHMSGITAALSASCREMIHTLLGPGRGRPPLISFDVNYRPGLWPVGEAAPVLAELARAADIVFVGQDEAEVLWGTNTPQQVSELLGTAACVVVKDGAVGATQLSGGSSVFVPAEEVDVVEVVGAGDAFAAGYLAGALNEIGPEKSLAQGHRLAARALGSMRDYVSAVGD